MITAISGGRKMYIDVNKFSDCLCDSDMIQMALDEAKVTGESVVIPKWNT